MEPTLACVAPSRRRALRAASAVAAGLPKTRVEAYSLAGYLARPKAPDRIVLCPAGVSEAADLQFLERAAARLLWPGPPRGLRAAIGGIRPHTEGPRRAETPRRDAERRAPTPTAALLLEGLIGSERALSALAASGPHDWIVESARHVRIAADLQRRLARTGIRWSCLEPIDLVGLYATPALARARGRWKAILPPRARVWIA